MTRFIGLPYTARAMKSETIVPRSKIITGSSGQTIANTDCNAAADPTTQK
jgi:hypothetical protein